MVKTKADVKLKIGEWIGKQTEPFTTQDVKQEIAPIATNIHLSPNRLTKFIRATGKAEFDHKNKEWKVRLTPETKIKSD
jgi:hypothetical protein